MKYIVIEETFPNGSIWVEEKKPSIVPVSNVVVHGLHNPFSSKDEAIEYAKEEAKRNNKRYLP